MAATRDARVDEFDLGQRFYARGEYELAADAFARAAARAEPMRKPESRYWAGLSWLGAGNAVQARSAFEDVMASGSPLHSLAQLGAAESWELARRPERALEELNAILAEGLGEAMPTALARVAALNEARGTHEVARQARDRLLRDWPASMESAEARLHAAAASRPGGANGTASRAAAR
jgi:tetratricopeptide (TPR) repeat protein